MSQSQTSKTLFFYPIVYALITTGVIIITSFVTYKVTKNNQAPILTNLIDTSLSTPTTAIEGSFSFSDLNPVDSKEPPAIVVKLNPNFGFKSNIIKNTESFGHLTYYKEAKFYELYRYEKWGSLYIQYIFLNKTTEGLPTEYQGTFSGYENYNNSLIPRLILGDKQSVDTSSPALPFYWKILGGPKSFEQPQYCHYTDYEKIADDGYGYLEICIPFSKFTSYNEKSFFNSDLRYLNQTIDSKAVSVDNFQMPWVSKQDVISLKKEINEISSSFTL